MKCFALQAWTPYLPFFGWHTLGALPTPTERLKLLQDEHVPFAKKQHAIFWASSNCFPKNDRITQAGRLLEALANSSLTLHSYGRCFKNVNVTEPLKGHTGHPDKIKSSGQFNFCLVRLQASCMFQVLSNANRS